MYKKIFLKLRRKITKNPVKIAKLHKACGVRMGDGCQIYGGVGFGSEPYLVQLGNNVKITSGVQFITHDGGVHVVRSIINEPIDLFGKIEVGDNVFIGLRSIIMPGVKIGSNCIIGAGSIVTKSVPDNTVVAGVPARSIKTIEDYMSSIASKVDKTKGLTSQEKRYYLTQKFNIEM